MFVLPLNIKTLSGEKLPAFNSHSISRVYTHDKLNKHFYYTKREFPFPFPKYEWISVTDMYSEIILSTFLIIITLPHGYSSPFRCL